MSRLFAPTLIVLFWITQMGNTAPVPAAVVEQAVADYLAVRPVEGIGAGLALSEALAAQRRFVALLEPRLGRPVGYKVGLVTRESQERYRVNAPVRGVLLSGMLLQDGAEVPLGFAVKPICEADLMVVVKDKRIHRARTPREVLKYLKEVVAFIELPDGVLSTNQPVDGAALVAVNVGARLGVIGSRLPVRADEDFAKLLELMTVTMTDQDGRELGRATGRAILDHPLNAVLWLAEELAHEGISLKPGDLISLGSVKNIAPVAGQTVTVTYTGLPGGPLRATVRFK